MSERARPAAGGEARAWLRARVAGLAGIDAATIDDDEAFASYGLDSPKLAELADAVAARFGVASALEAVFAHPTVARLAAALAHGPAPSRALAGEAAARTGDPLAIVGIACRFPGAPGRDAFWRLLRDGGVATAEVPPGRWDPGPADAGDAARAASRWGGFLPDVERFDARFFGIRPAEAQRMDPQQRLLLETAWEALEDAGAVPARLRGSATGVFAGISVSDYGARQRDDPLGVDAFVATGNALSVAANRVSYALDLRGPSLAVDTACSSSLVALHLACRSLASGESELALAAGVNVLLEPDVAVALASAGALAADGRCLPFDADAHGYVRAEGCGVVVLKPLSAARRDGDRVYALVRGTAVNQDGSTNGLTAPNPLAQRAAMQAALADAGAEPGDVALVECHGTGTPLGDPIEASSVGAVVGAARDGAAPCVVRSTKGNVGHLESAAGIAGVIATALALHHGEVPPSGGATRPSPLIDFDGLGLSLALERRPLPAPAGLAIVNSFGFGGTNASAVLEAAGEAAERAAAPGDEGAPRLVPISAPSAAALERHVGDWRAWLAATEAPLASVAHTAGARRTHHSWRVAAVGADSSELRGALDGAAAERPAAPGGARVAFVFPGQGWERAGMAAGLLACEPLFASVLRRCDEALAAAGFDLSVVAEIERAGGDPIADTVAAQPVGVSVAIALATLLRAHGVEPAAVVGHSVGEIAAAHVAGALSLRDAVVLAARRGRALGEAVGSGTMLAVGAPAAEAEEIVARLGGRVEIAAVNGPRTVVLSGEEEALEALRRELVGDERWARRLPVRYPAHSRWMRPAAERLAAACADLRPRAADVPLISTVTGGELGAELPGAEHWRRNACEPVRFADAIGRVLERGVDVLLEVDADPILRTPLRELTADRADVAVVSTLAPGRDDRRALLDALGRLWERGCDLRWERLSEPGAGVVSLPAHPWERERHWVERSQRGRRPAAGHPLLGERIDLAAAGARTVWEGELDLRALPFLADHRVGGEAVLPGAAVVEAALAAARAAGLDGALAVRGLRLERPLALGDEPVRVQLVADADDDGALDVALHARGDGGWARHARATVAAAPAGAAPRVDLDAARARCEHQLDPAELYAALGERGLSYGPAFRALRDVRAGAGEAVARVAVDAAGARPYACDPRLLDGALQALAAAAGPDAAPNGPPLAAAIDEVVRHARPGHEAHVVAKARAADGGLVGDVVVCDADGRATVELRGVRVRSRAACPAPARALACRLYDPVWRPRPLAGEPAADGRWLVLGDGDGLADALADALAAAGADAVRGALDAEAAGAGGDGEDGGGGSYHERLLAAALADGVPLRGVAVVAPGRDEAPGPRRAARGAAALAGAVRALSLAHAAAGAELAVVTRGAWAARPGDRCDDPFAAALWGIARVLPFENPLLAHRCVDADAGGEAPARLARELLHGGQPDVEVALRGGERLVRRLVARRAQAPAGARDCVGPGTYLVTGGLGGLGLAVAEWLVERGATGLALVGRGPARAAAQPALERLRAAGAEVMTLEADVRSRAQIGAALERVRASLPPLRGVVHAAGILDDRPLLDLPEESLHAVLGPKVDGGANLLELTERDALDWLVLFSSAASVLGSPGQASYCAANAVLDALAEHGRARGRPVVAVDWGPWAEVGMVAAPEIEVASAQGRGAVSSIAPRDGVLALERILADAATRVVALGFELEDLLQYYPPGPGLSLFEDLTGPGAAADAAALPVARVARRPELEAAYVAPRTELEERIAAIWRRGLGIDRVGVADGLFELGGDSIFANQVLVDLERAFGVAIDPEQAFRAFTVENLAALVERAMVDAISQLSDEDAARLAAEPD